MPEGVVASSQRPQAPIFLVDAGFICVDLQEDATEHVGAVLNRVKHEYLVSCRANSLAGCLGCCVVSALPRVVDDDQTIVRTIRCFAMMTDIESR